MTLQTQGETKITHADALVGHEEGDPLWGLPGAAHSCDCRRPPNIIAKIDLHLPAWRRLEAHRSRASASSSRRYGFTACYTVRMLTKIPFSVASSWRITSALPR